MADTIRVKGPGTDNTIILWEVDAAHPNGEVLIANDGTSYEVAETATVRTALGNGRLLKAESGDKPNVGQENLKNNPDLISAAPAPTTPPTTEVAAAERTATPAPTVPRREADRK